MTSDQAHELYAQLYDARTPAAIRHRYRRMNTVFRLCLEAETPAAGLRFGGAFAQTEYLLRQHHATPAEARAIHGARVRMSAYGRLPAPQLETLFERDIAALAHFLRLVTGIASPLFPEAATLPDAATDAATDVRPVPTDYCRLVVTRCENKRLFGTIDGSDAEEVCISLEPNDVATYHDWDWTYVSRIADEGTQLNIVRPRTREGIIYPELIIVEPDYLVDITSVAACFEDYAHTPLTLLLAQLRPQPTTSAILLGNMASQLLDEELSLPPDERTYAKSARRFFTDNALALATTPLSDTFHADARKQQQNIRRALHEGLGQHVAGFDPQRVILEPSFFSEMLGLQGRMDFLSLDFSLLIEQKSGRCGFPQRDPATPVQAEKHYVQMLLYMLVLRYNFSAETSRSGYRLLAFLLYSKYANSLLSLGFAPALVAEAIRMRNEIAAAEFSYMRGGLDVLATLHAEDLNMRHVRSVLWRRYQLPQLEEVLTPIRAASPLEQAYFLRMLAFLHTEHLLAKVGARTSTSHGFAEKWHSTLAEKLEAGSIAAAMQLLPPSDEGRVTELTFRLAPLDDDAISDFRRGDIVIVYPYRDGDEPDARHTMVFRATITRLTADAATLRLRAPQTSPRLFIDHAAQPWAMEHDFMEASFSTLYRGLHATLCAPASRRELLFMQRRPRCNDSLRLRGDHGTFDELALRVRQAEELFLIIGPPGTGKTSYGLMSTLREALLDGPQASALLAAFTNRAVDEICSKLHEAGIPFVRIGGGATSEPWLRPYLLETHIADATNADDVRRLLLTTRIFVGTTAGVAAAAPILRTRSFDVAIIDEASQILEPHLLPLWSATTDDGQLSIRKFVLIGDHCQLAAVVQQPSSDSAVEDPRLHAIGLTDCRDSLFERLLRRYRDDPSVTYMLTRQGRMHADIAAFPSQAFYAGRLQPVPLPHQLRPLPATAADIPEALRRRVAFVDVEPRGGISDKVNDAEAEAIVSLLGAIHTLECRHFDPQQTVGVIVPYRNQIAAIRQRLARLRIEALDAITIDTVERFQGSQRDYIIYGFTVRHRHQLRFLTANAFDDQGHIIDRKLNVAMTRAREHLIIIGHERLLATNPVFRSLLDHIRGRE